MSTVEAEIIAMQAPEPPPPPTAQDGLRVAAEARRMTADAPSEPPAAPPTQAPKGLRAAVERSTASPVRVDLAEVRSRWARLPRRYRWACWALAAVFGVLVLFRYVVPWASPEPDVVTITVPQQAATATTSAQAGGLSGAGKSTSAGAADRVDPLGWGPGPVAPSARAMIGATPDGLNPERATAVSKDAQKLLRTGVQACDLRLIVPKPGALAVLVEKTEGSVPLFDCTPPSTTSTTR